MRSPCAPDCPVLHRACRAFAVALATLLLGACAAGTGIDLRYRAVSQDSRVRFIIVHFTQADFERSLRRLTREEVSSHYLVDVDPPRVFQLVPEARRAWHAGPSYWQGATALNASSVGIEIVNLGNGDDPARGYAPFPDRQIERVIGLIREIARRHGVRPDRILGHAEVQPRTRTDPGPQFPWRRLAEAGLVPWPDPARVAAARVRFESVPATVMWIQERLAAHGYDVPRDGVLDSATRRVISIFQMRYRPARYDGDPDAETAALLEVVTAPGGLLLADGQGRWMPFRPE
ncbi:MAG: N-acetylmuramoyl-L-alanine amidase [Proteobacteria bacterium]|nr:N-acetylmuramoyl-L-alanine amidase [Pseudomonadota bacterium]